MNGLEYYELHKSESCGTHGSFGLQVRVAISPPHIRYEPDEDGPQIVLDVPAILNDEAVRHAMYDVEKVLTNTIRRVALSKMPHIAEQAKKQREELLAGFGSDAILVEELPNGYCPDYCCAHLKWFLVTTKLGRIKIGWRKRVINIDWSDTKDTKTSEELFPSESTTKETRLIHAWGYEKARAYVGAILTGVTLQPQNVNVSNIPA
jgi:hypothetical protein